MTGPNVQKVKTGVRRSAGCVMIVLVAFLMPSERQRVPNAYEGLDILVMPDMSDDAHKIITAYM